MHYLSIGAVARDEDYYIEEWLKYHRLVGVEHFFLFDNGSVKPLTEFLRSHKDVTVFQHNGSLTHGGAFASCVAYYGHETFWMACIDLDQFLVPLQGTDIRPAFSLYEKYIGIAVNWQTFGSAGHLTRPQGGVLDNYLHRARSDYRLNENMQTVVRSAVTSPLPWPSPHLPAHQYGEVVNERFMPMGQPPIYEGNEPQAIRTHFQLNHYFLKSEEEWQQKMRRGICGGTTPPHMESVFYTHNEHCNEVYDDRALQIYRGNLVG